MALDQIKQIGQWLETEQSFGILELPRPDRMKNVRAEMRPEAMPVSSVESLAQLEMSCRGCALCPLSGTRTQTVFGTGNPSAKLMFIGEAPGFDEDQQGKPFVGLAGQLLTKIIEAMGMKRDEVFIANCLKCRPPNNRNPLPTEIVACAPYLAKQIELIKPKVICALGKFAAQTLLKTEEPISRLRGRFFEKDGLQIMPTFHPAYLLRNPADKKLVWKDMKEILKRL